MWLTSRWHTLLTSSPLPNDSPQPPQHWQHWQQLQKIWKQLQATCFPFNRSSNQCSARKAYTCVTEEEVHQQLQEGAVDLPIHVQKIPFVFAIASADELVDSIGALKANDVDELLNILCAAIRDVDVSELKKQRTRFGSMLVHVHDPAGEQAYALTCVVAACECVLAEHKAVTDHEMTATENVASARDD